MSYQPPLKDIRFTLDRVVGFADTLPDGIEPRDVDAVLEEAGKFAAGVLAPLNATGDRNPARIENGVVRTAPGWVEAYRQFVQGGWNAVSGDPEHGGQGLPVSVASAINELWNSANMAFGLCPMLTQAAIELLEKQGTEAQRRMYLSRLIEGSWTGTMNLTEPQAGSDLAAVRTKAERADGHYRVTGQKIFITYGEHDLTENIIHLVLARLPDAPPGVKGISLFLVPKFRVNEDGSLGARNDLRCVSLEHKLGIHASPTGVMAFGDDGGAWAELIGEENRGLEYMFIMMNNARLAVGVQGVAIAERAYQQARDYARSRVQGKPMAGGTAIVGHPDVRRMLMLSKIRIEAARALDLEAAAMLDRARKGVAGAQARTDLMIPLCKAWSTDIGIEVASTGIQIHGGMGFIEETGAAQHYRDARIAAIYEGTNGIQAQDLVGRKVLRDKGAAMTALLGDIGATVEALRGQPGDDLAVVADRLAEARGALQSATAWVLDQAGEDAQMAYAVSVPYLELAAITAAGWMMARAGLAAQEDLMSRAGDPDFAEAKLISARCFAEHVLTRADGLDRSIREGARSLLALQEDLF